MANEFRARQFALDSVILIADAVPDKLHKGDQVRWVGATTGGHEAILTSVGGDIIYHGEATGANFNDTFTLNRDYNDGFYLPTLGSGTLYITKRTGSAIS